MAKKIPRIDSTRCSGCGRCIAACKPGLFAFEPLGWRKVSVLHDAGSCTGCTLCVANCVIGAMSMVDANHDQTACSSPGPIHGWWSTLARA